MDEKSLIRAYKIVSLYFRISEPSDLLKEQFVEWLLSEHNWEEKDAALEFVFSQIMNGVPNEEEYRPLEN